MKSVDLQVAYGAVKHFGRNLYTSNPPAIAELVANSWDAYATMCQIIEKEGALAIIDNGIGMSDFEFQNRYAVSGTDKNTDSIRKPEEMLARPYMGRKGIGKFSAFSLGEEYILYTKSSGEDLWKKVSFCYNSLLVNEAIITLPVEKVDSLKEIEEIFECEINMETGTIIHIPIMRRKFIKSTVDNLSKILSRRFSVNVTERYDFGLNINSAEVDLKEHFYDEYIEFIYYFGMGKNEVQSRFSNISDGFLFEIESDFFKVNNVSGWIGSVSEPNQLKIEDELSSSGIIVYINGKLADENILKNVQNARMSNVYVVGEVNADFLQDENEDPVLSSREGLNMELDNVDRLKEEVDKVRRQLVNVWNDLRSSRMDSKQSYLQTIINDEVYAPLYKVMNTEQKNRVKKYAQRLFDRSDQDNESYMNYYKPVIFSIANSETINDIEIEEGDEVTTILSKFYELFDKTEVNSALRIKSNIQDRLNVIDELNKDIDEEAREKVFEKHLEANPWLINPYWDKSSQSIATSTQESFKSLLKDNSVDSYTDIIVRVAEEQFPIICELKREKKTAYSNPDITEISTQITKYRRGILNELRTLGKASGHESYTQIKAFFICGEHVLRNMPTPDKEQLQQLNIELMCYKQIITNAKNMYSQAVLSEFQQV